MKRDAIEFRKFYDRTMVKPVWKSFFESCSTVVLLSRNARCLGMTKMTASVPTESSMVRSLHICTTSAVCFRSQDSFRAEGADLWPLSVSPDLRMRALQAVGILDVYI